VALPVVLGGGVPLPVPLGDAPHEDVSDGVGVGDPEGVGSGVPMLEGVAVGEGEGVGEGKGVVVSSGVGGAVPVPVRVALSLGGAENVAEAEALGDRVAEGDAMGEPDSVTLPLAVGETMAAYASAIVASGEGRGAAGGASTAIAVVGGVEGRGGGAAAGRGGGATSASSGRCESEDPLSPVRTAATKVASLEADHEVKRGHAMELWRVAGFEEHWGQCQGSSGKGVGTYFSSWAPPYSSGL
jgi:hypothetical protein